jgi:signal transduction histidine kinase
VGLLGLLMAYWVARPVRRLAAAARRITTAGLNEAAPEAIETARPGHALDEIGELALAFKTMLESLRRSQDELLKNERLASTGKLAASVAHEIRNPLTSLRMTIEMMQQRSVRSGGAGGGAAGETDEATREGYAVVLREIDRLALAVEELLTFARPRPPTREPVDLNQLVRDVLKFLEHQLVHARVGSKLELDAAMPAELPLDPNKIRQLLVNLILNAQQAIVRDGAVTVRTRWDAKAKRATLSVIDTGPGIAEEVREKVFELFVSTKAGGGGIGLAIAKQIAEEHGGAIGFETSPKGTTFNVELATE